MFSFPQTDGHALQATVIPGSWWPVGFNLLKPQCICLAFTMVPLASTKSMNSNNANNTAAMPLRPVASQSFEPRCMDYTIHPSWSQYICSHVCSPICCNHVCLPAIIPLAQSSIPRIWSSPLYTWVTRFKPLLSRLYITWGVLIPGVTIGPHRCMRWGSRWSGLVRDCTAKLNDRLWFSEGQEEDCQGPQHKLLPKCLERLLPHPCLLVELPCFLPQYPVFHQSPVITSRKITLFSINIYEQLRVQS